MEGMESSYRKIFIPHTEISPLLQWDLAKRDSHPAHVKRNQIWIETGDKMRSQQITPAQQAGWLASIGAGRNKTIPNVQVETPLELYIYYNVSKMFENKVELVDVFL